MSEAIEMSAEQRNHQKNISATSANGVQCLLDQKWVHSIAAYLKIEHPGVSVADYQARFPDAPLLSPTLIAAQAKKKQDEAVLAHAATVVPFTGRPTASTNIGKVVKKPFGDTFGLTGVKGTLNVRSEPIMIDGLTDLSSEFADYVPEIDKNYVFDIEILRPIMMGFQLNIPTYLWGKHGTGKTSYFEQYCARTNRPAIRVQHTVSTEEAHVLGQYVVKDGSTHFEPGPLAIAMRFGLTYIADEYDFALPSVTSVYQPVLEGKQLIIKEAPPEWRVVKPHPMFRFVATGNTNGSGDETGLYQGTQLQNAANYSRFGITVEVGYMAAAHEIAVIVAQAEIFEVDAKALRKFAEDVRLAYIRGEIGLPISPRELIRAAILARTLGAKYIQGLSLAFINRLNSTDKKAVMDVAQRHFKE